MKPVTLAVFMTYILISMGLSACGVKPASLQPPSHTQDIVEPKIETPEIKEETIETPTPKTDNRRMTGY